MAIKTTLAQLEEVQSAITSVMSGQMYRIGEVTFTRATLSQLQDREKMLLIRYRREQRNKGRVRLNMSDGV